LPFKVFRSLIGAFDAKLSSIRLGLGGAMEKGFNTSLLEKVPVLILLGILAGAIGGLGIGLIQTKTASSASVGR
jgi:hypothetical protein